MLGTECDATPDVGGRYAKMRNARPALGRLFLQLDGPQDLHTVAKAVGEKVHVKDYRGQGSNGN